jgi:hypothetical protein
MPSLTHGSNRLVGEQIPRLSPRPLARNNQPERNVRVIRNGEELTIKITPTVRVMNYGPDNPVPTLAPGDWYGY